MTTIWIVDDDKSLRWIIHQTLKPLSHRLQTFATVAEVHQAMLKNQPDLVLLDIRLPDGDGLTLMEALHQQWVDLPVIIMTAMSHLQHVLTAHQQGAWEYLAKPFDLNELLSLVQRALQPSSQTRPTIDQPSLQFIGQSHAMQTLFKRVACLAHGSQTLLILGETGTGKNHLAQLIHQHSDYAQGPLVVCPVAGQSTATISADLFGAERTGNQSLRPGRIEQAAGGTLVIDEIGDATADTQGLLLRLLADKTFYRQGGYGLRQAEVRLLVTSQYDLAKRVAQGQFRQDLWYRLNGFILTIPPLRQRQGDVPLLLDYGLAQASLQYQRSPCQPTPESYAQLNDYHWPGNVRQLLQLCHEITLISSKTIVTPENLPAFIANTHGTPQWCQGLQDWAQHRWQDGDRQLMAKAVPLFENSLLQAALQVSGGQRQKAAHLLGWGRNTLTRKIQQLIPQPPPKK